MLAPVYLDYKSMVAHDFIVKDKNRLLNYKLRFDEIYCEIVTLPAPSLFDCPQASTSLHQMPSASTKARHKLQSLSQNHHLILPVNLFMGGIWTSLPTSGTQRTHLSTLEGVALIRGHRPT